MHTNETHRPSPREPNRRRALQWGAAALGVAIAPKLAKAQRGDGAAFTRQTVIDEAQAIAARPFQPKALAPNGLRNIDYDAYRQIRYRKEEAIWRRASTQFSVELFAPGYLYEHGVDIFIVESGQAFQLAANAESFDTPTETLRDLLAQVGQFAGFRLHYPINRADYADEFIAFQGASYFRAVSERQTYGLSARGLAINVGEPQGEEFPIFRRFWIERPSAEQEAIVVHALLDSESVAGAYRFGIYPGPVTTMDVDARLFARRRLNHVGIGALTSMYAHGPIDDADRADYRPMVHDSEGLAMWTGRGERLWRPLRNPRELEISLFGDENPRGFGLIQRTRDFAAYQDLEATYNTRPSAWIEPLADWGRGAVQLVEIPSNSEFNDNIVAYWRPQEPLLPGEPRRFAYRLSWPDDAPTPAEQLRAVRSAEALAVNSSQEQFAIDFTSETPMEFDTLDFELSLSTGEVLNFIVQPNPAINGVRCFVTFDPGAASMTEIRLQPLRQGAPAGETWLYRWIKS